MAIIWILLMILISVKHHDCQTFVNVPTSVNVYEEEKSQIVLANLECTHTNPIRVDLTSISPLNPCQSCFAIYRITPNPHYQLFFLPSQGNVTYSIVPIYNIVATCTDDITSVTTVINVRVRTNEPPTFASATDTVTSINAKTTIKGTVVYTVPDATDPDLDAIFYNLTVFPASSQYKYEIGLTDGKVRAKEDLSSECFPTLVFFVHIHDNRNVMVGPKVITVQFSDYYTVPYISVLNKELTVAEDLAVGDIVGPADITATANTPTVTYTFQTFPVSSAYLFEIPTTLPPRLLLANKLNWEGGINNINITITPDNDFCTPDIFFLYLTIIDANDPPVMTPRDIVTWEYEGTVTYNPGFVVTDEDSGDSYSFSILPGPNSALFAIDPQTGIITSPNYDIDGGANPTQVVLTIQVQDTKGPATDNTTVTINFLDTNDNPPVFGGTTFAASVEDCSPAGMVLGTIPVSDPVDTAYNDNNVAECVPSSNGNLFVLADCTFVLNNSFPEGSVSVLYVTATDLGTFPGPLTSASSASVIVTSTPCTTTSTPTIPPTTTPPTTTTPTTTTPTTTIGGINSLISASSTNADDATSSNIAWIVVSCVVGCIAVAAAAFFVTRFCLPKCNESGSKFKPGSGGNNRTNPQQNQNQFRSNTQKNTQKPVTPREVKPFEPKEGPDAYRLAEGGNPNQQKNVWHGMGQQPDRTFDL